MILLLIGLLVFLGIHSTRMLADDKRSALIDSKGDGLYKVGYSLLSLLGLVLLIVGYGQSRLSADFIWHPPVFMAHIASLLMLISFVLLAAAYVPGNRIKARVGHPMVLAVKVWAFAHLLANGRLGDIILFGSFLVWAIVNYIISRKRDRLSGKTYPSVDGFSRDGIAIVVGIAAWLVFALWAHLKLIGVSPFGA